jgi:hypothetical protein
MILVIYFLPKQWRQGHGVQVTIVQLQGNDF